MKNKTCFVLLICLIAVFCFLANCQKTPIKVAPNPGFQGEVGEGSSVSDDDITETKVITKNVQNSTWLLLGQEIIRTIRFLYIFTLIAVIIYKWIRDGSISILGSGRK